MTEFDSPKRVIRVRTAPSSEVQHNQAPASSSPIEKPPVRTGMTKEQIKAATDEVADMITYPRGETEARKAMRAKYGMTAKQTNRLIQAILRSWHKETEAGKRFTKVQSVRRIESHLKAAAKKQSWAAVAMFEQQLAKIQGTEEPVIVKVDVNLGPVVAGVLAAMDPEYMDSLVREYDQLEQVARTRALPAKPEVLEGEIVEEQAERFHKP